MTKISKQEVLKIARMSHIDVHEHEIDAIVTQLEQVLSYAACVANIGAQKQEGAIKNVNVMRADVPVVSDAQEILSRAPEREGSHFVVPKIVKSN